MLLYVYKLSCIGYYSIVCVIYVYYIYIKSDLKLYYKYTYLFYTIIEFYLTSLRFQLGSNIRVVFQLRGVVSYRNIPHVFFLNFKFQNNLAILTIKKKLNENFRLRNISRNWKSRQTDSHLSPGSHYVHNCRKYW